MDDGENWMSINNGLTDTLIASLVVNSIDHLFASTGDGIFRSIDNGDSWEKISDEIVQNLSVNSIDFLFCSSHGIVLRSSYATSVHDYKINHPENWYLAQNYPNPFNPTTTIKYYLPESGRIALKVYSLTGQEIETLIDDFHPAGEHEINWSAKGMSSGIYFYRLQTGKYIKTKKFIIQK